MTALAWREAGLRWYKYSFFLRQRFGQPLRRVSLGAGLTCPNRDGRISRAGCHFCNPASFSPALRQPVASIREQLQRGLRDLTRVQPQDGVLAYFQSGTNTYAPVARLRAMYEEALNEDCVRGAIIGTRPDCLPEDVVKLLEELARRTYLALELGLQTTNDAMLARINRGHDARCFFNAVERLSARGIEVGVHMILGFPGDTEESAAAMARELSAAGVNAVKIHNLQIMTNTPLEESYKRGEIALCDEDQYLALVRAFLLHLSPDIVVQRLVGDVMGNHLVAPRFPSSKSVLMQRLERELVRDELHQGALIP